MLYLRYGSVLSWTPFRIAVWEHDKAPLWRVKVGLVSGSACAAGNLRSRPLGFSVVV